MSTLHRTVRRSILKILPAAALGATAMLVAACSGASLTPAAPGGLAPSGAARSAAAPNLESSKTFQFITLDNANDPTFNQLLGINSREKIAGYFGSGLSGHPNKGYTLKPPYGQNDYKNENYPGSAQTQVTALNNLGDTAGFWVDNSNVNRGFVEWNGVFTSYKDPKTGAGTVNQILGLNDKGIAVGFYTDASGINHGFTLDQATGKFKPVNPPGGMNVTASGINGLGDITGFYSTSSSGPDVGFIEKNGQFSTFSFPAGASTTPLGINDRDQIVGSYMDGSGNMHGFLLSQPLSHAKWVSIDDPNGVGTTTINGLNDRGRMVGFYVDAAGNTDGMLITP